MKPDYDLVWKERVKRCGKFCRFAVEQDWPRDHGLGHILAASCGMVIEARCGGKWRAVWWMVRQILLGYRVAFTAWRWRNLSEEEFIEKMAGLNS